MKTVAEILRPAHEQDDFTKWMLDRNGGWYIGARKLPDGTYAGIQSLAFTYGICLGVTPQDAAQRRFCFRHLADCLLAFDKLQSFQDWPVGWVASRPKPLVEDWNPLETAPRDGTVLRMANFAFGHCHYCRYAAYQDGDWIEVDSTTAGQPLENPTHWLP